MINSQEKQELLPIFLEAKETLSDPRRWTKRAYARDKSHRKINPYNSKAVSFCLSGALLKASLRRDSEKHGKLHLDSLNFIKEEYFQDKKNKISHFNDAEERKHKEIIDLLDKCIYKLLVTQKREV